MHSSTAFIPCEDVYNFKFRPFTKDCVPAVMIIWRKKEEKVLARLTLS